MNLEFLAFLGDVPYDRLHLGIIAGILVSIVATAYAFQIHRHHLHVNIATWGMILLIDILGLILALSSGNSEPYIHLAWVGTDVFICFAILSLRSNWFWSKIETASLIFFALALIGWVVFSSTLAIICYLIACFFTLLPQAIQYWKDKRVARKSAWIWVMNSAALVMTILSLGAITPEYTFVTLGLLFLNLGMVMIALR